MKGELKILVHGEKEVRYVLKRSKRARSLRITITGDGVCVLTVPYTTSEWTISSVMSKKALWIIEKIEHFKNLSVSDTRIRLGSGKKSDYLTHKEQARKMVHEKLEYFQQFYAVSWGRVSIKNTTTRWGSCSKLRNLNFSYKIGLLPEELLEYIVVHEMCHLIELNHSEAFWGEVAKTIPKYKQLRNQLKQYV